MAKTNVASEKIRIRLKAYDHVVLEQSAEKIVDTAKKTGAKVSGPIPLPTEKEIVTILRSPHKHKDSREQFEMTQRRKARHRPVLRVRPRRSSRRNGAQD